MRWKVSRWLTAVVVIAVVLAFIPTGNAQQKLKVGFIYVGPIGAYPIPEVKRHLDAYALGVRYVNPQATINVRWLQDWFSPPKAKEATQALIADGVDVFAFTEDSPTVIQESAKKNLLSFAHYSPMYKFAPKQVVSGELVHWETIYLDFLRKVLAGKYTADNLQDVDYWWLLAEKAVA